MVSPASFSTSGALVLANSQGIDRQVFYRQLISYGALITLVAPAILWIVFVLIPT